MTRTELGKTIGASGLAAVINTIIGSSVFVFPATVAAALGAAGMGWPRAPSCRFTWWPARQRWYCNAAEPATSAFSSGFPAGR